jgi:hypothetical protein
MDGQVLTTALDGRAIAIDPGTHAFQFELSPYPPMKETVVVREGENDRIVSIDFTPGGTAESGRIEQGASAVRGPVPLATYLLAGAGLASVTGFVVLAESAMADTHALGCAPFCSTSIVAPIRTKYAIGDALLGIGVVSFSLAAFFYIARPNARPNASSSLTSVFDASAVAGPNRVSVQTSWVF